MNKNKKKRQTQNIKNKPRFDNEVKKAKGYLVSSKLQLVGEVWSRLGVNWQGINDSNSRKKAKKPLFESNKSFMIKVSFHDKALGHESGSMVLMYMPTSPNSLGGRGDPKNDKRTYSEDGSPGK